MANIKTLNLESLGFPQLTSDKLFIKLILTILLPLLLIVSNKELRQRSGIYFGQMKNSLLIAWTSFYAIGPASSTFALIGLFGWTFKDWPGSIMVSTAFLVALFIIPKITQRLSSPNEKKKHSLKYGFLLLLLSVLSVVVSLTTENRSSILLKALYYLFIVAVGEELLFRGYLQSSFNLFFGKKFKIRNVEFGWGLILTAILFGLIHSLVSSPPIWPWMLFTFVGGLILGFVREKDGSLLAPIALHALMDSPLIFLT